MNRNRVKGTIDGLVGTVKRKAGELTDDVQLQMEGIAQQVKGGIEKSWGQAKNAIHDANKKPAGPHV